MNTRLRSGMCLAVTFFLTSTIIFSTAQVVPDRYWYISLIDDQIVAFRTLNPVNPVEYQTIFETELPQNVGFNDAVLSPDKKWAALDLGYAQNSGVLLINLQTRETLFTGNLFLNIFPLGSLNTPSHRLVWSPNSQMIAFHLFVPDSPQSESQVVVYDLVRKQLFNLNAGLTNQYNFVWLPDSRIIAVLTFSEEQHLTWFELFETTQWMSERQFSFLSLGLGITGASTFCQVAISPDGSRMSFWYPCEGASFDLPREIYILDLTTGNIQPATHISDPRQDFKPQIILFTSEWLPDGNLLIGASYKTITREGAQTLQFNPATNQLTTIDDRQSFLEQAINPVTGEVAVLNQESLQSGGDEEHKPALSLQLGTGQVIPITLTEGCRLSWSPSGQTLAYVITRAYCHTPTIRSIEFIDRVTRQQTSHLISDSEQVVALGWR